MIDGLMFFMFLLGVFMLGMLAGAVSCLFFIRYTITYPMRERLKYEEETNERQA